MKILIILQKDLLLIFRDRKSLIFFVLMPVIFTAFMGFALNTGGSSSTPEPLSIGWIDQDTASPLSQALLAGLQADSGLALRILADTPQADLEPLLGQQNLAAIVIVPAGYDQAVQNGQSFPLRLYLNGSSQAASTVNTAVENDLKTVLGSLQIAHLAGKPEAFPTMLASLANPAFTVVTQAADDGDTVLAAQNSYNQSSPGMMVMFAIFGLTTTAMVLVNERQANTLQRMLAGGVRPLEAMLGHGLAMFMVVFLQSLLLMLLGQFVFKVDYLANPLASLLAIAVLGLWVSALGLLIGELAKGPEQVTMFGMLAMFLLAALGGAMFPLDFAGTGVLTLGKFLPSSWSMHSFQDILIHGQNLAAILPALAVQLAFAAAFLGLATSHFFRRRV